MGPHAAAPADPPSVAGLSRSSSQQGTSLDAPEEPALQSSVGQHAASDAQQASAGSIDVPGKTAPSNSSKQAAEEEPSSEEGGAETEGRVEGRLGSCSGEQAGGPDGPREPDLQSGLGQQAAVTEGGLLFAPISLCYRLCYFGHPTDLERSGWDVWCVFALSGPSLPPDDASSYIGFNLSAHIELFGTWTCV